VARRYSEAGLYEEALSAAREAVEIRRQLAMENFARHGSGLAHGLHELSYLLQRVGRYAEALVAGTEEIDLRRKTAHLGRKHLRLFVSALDYYVRLESDVNLAMARLSEAIIILSELARDDPSSGNLEAFSRGLQTRSHLLEQIGDYQGALRDMEESIGTHRALLKPRGRQSHHRSLLAGRLQLYSELLNKMGMIDRAKLAREEAAAIYRTIRQTPGKANSI
jgi:tetratricopeptide (TPR) repeat protein